MPIEITDLPHVLAGLNTTAACLLVAAYIFIRAGNREKHRACMLGAVSISALFLVVYLYYHFNSGLAKFGGEGWIRPVYFSILIAHVIGAVAITPLVPLTLWRALRGDFDRHRKIARITWPLWLYVSVSGVIVYVMAIHLFPTAAG